MDDIERERERGRERERERERERDLSLLIYHMNDKQVSGYNFRGKSANDVI